MIFISTSPFLLCKNQRAFKPFPWGDSITCSSSIWDAELCYLRIFIYPNVCQTQGHCPGSQEFLCLGQTCSKASGCVIQIKLQWVVQTTAKTNQSSTMTASNYPHFKTNWSVCAMSLTFHILVQSITNAKPKQFFASTACSSWGSVAQLLSTLLLAGTSKPISRACAPHTSAQLSKGDGILPLPSGNPRSSTDLCRESKLFEPCWQRGFLLCLSLRSRKLHSQKLLR